MDNKKVLRGLKKVAAVFSAGAMMLPLTACKAKNRLKELTVQSCLDEYMNNYDSGNITNGMEMYDYFADVYSQYEKRAKKTDFIGPVPEFASRPTISEVTIKTNEEHLAVGMPSIVITVDESNTYTVHTKNMIKTEDSTYEQRDSLYVFKPNGSYSITEEMTDSIVKVEFDKKGLIEALETSDSSTREVYKYENGNMDVYSLYGKNNELLKRMNEDGSYSICEYNKIVHLPNDDYYSEGSYDRVVYNYDRYDNLINVEAYNNKQIYYMDCIDGRDGVIGFDGIEQTHTIYQLNNDSYTFAKYYDKYGEYAGTKRTTEKYGMYRDTVENRIVDGKNVTIVSRYDYSVPSPLRFERDVFSESMGNLIYKSIDGNITTQMKDGIIYKYTPENGVMRRNERFGISYQENCPPGCFIDAYSIEEDGIMHYNEDGSKYYFENQLIGKIAFYDENGEVEYTRIESKNDEGNVYMVTEYYGDENSNMQSVRNISEDVIEIEANGQKFILGKEGNIKFYKNGEVSEYINTFDKSVNFKVKDTEYTINENEKLSFYENGQEHIIENNKMYKSFYKNGNILEVVNYQDDSIISEAGYELKKDSYISFTEEGELISYFYDDNYNIKNDFYADDKIRTNTIIQDGLETITDHSFGYTVEKIKNIKEDSEVNIKGYDLKYGSSIEFDEYGGMKYIYDESYTICKEVYPNSSQTRTKVEKDGKMYEYYDYGDGRIKTICYEKPVENKTGKVAANNLGLSGKYYTVIVEYDENDNIKSVVSKPVSELPKDDGYTFTINDRYNNVYEISRGSSIYFNSDGSIIKYNSGNEIEAEDR